MNFEGADHPIGVIGTYGQEEDFTGKFYVITDHGMSVADEDTIKKIAEANKTRYYKWGEEPGHFEKGAWVKDYPMMWFKW